MVDLSGRTGIVSKSSPAIFLQNRKAAVDVARAALLIRSLHSTFYGKEQQKSLTTSFDEALVGLLVYGLQGREIYKRNLNQEVCRETLLYSLEQKVPLVAFSQDRCFSMYDDPLVDSLHCVYHEPKAETVSSIDWLLGTAEIQAIGS